MLGAIRLFITALKLRYDPANLLRVNQNSQAGRVTRRRFVEMPSIGAEKIAPIPL